MADKLEGFITQREANELFPVSPRTRQRLQQCGLYPQPARRHGNRLFYKGPQAFLQALDQAAKPAVNPGAAAIEAASFLGRKGQS